MFIVFEGLDGCGKTTQVQLLHYNLIKLGYGNVVALREPGNTYLAEQIRDYLLNDELNDVQRMFLFLSARNSIVEEVIKPFLKHGDIVLCDRYAASTLAYQGYGKNVADISLINKMNNIACDNVHPDLTIFIDVPVEECKKRQQKYDKMEQSSMDVYEKIYNGYKQLSKNNDWVVVDGTKAVEDVAEEILDIVKKKIK